MLYSTAQTVLHDYLVCRYEGRLYGGLGVDLWMLKLHTSLAALGATASSFTGHVSGVSGSSVDNLARLQHDVVWFVTIAVCGEGLSTLGRSQLASTGDHAATACRAVSYLSPSWNRGSRGGVELALVTGTETQLYATF